MRPPRVCATLCALHLFALATACTGSAPSPAPAPAWQAPGADVPRAPLRGAPLIEDRDGDGVADAEDACPDDPTGSAPQAWYADCDEDGVYASEGVEACGQREAAIARGCPAPLDARRWSPRPGDDCDDDDPLTSERRQWYPDCDGDGVFAGGGAVGCGADGVAAAFGALGWSLLCAHGGPPKGGWSELPGDDCDDDDPARALLREWYPDCDGDGAPRGAAVLACGAVAAAAAFRCEDGRSAPAWAAAPGSDCADDNPLNPCPCGEQDNDGDGSCEPVASLLDALELASGVQPFPLASGATVRLLVDASYAGGGWVLVGRGREGWAWSEAGLGNPSTLWKRVGKPAAFAPAYLPSATIQALIDAAGLRFTDVEVRVRRAASPLGDAYQEVRWQPTERQTWTWLLDTEPYDIELRIDDSVLGAGLFGINQTRDFVGRAGNNHQRLFTWAWDGHGGQQGFAYGATISDDPAVSPGFLWEQANEQHAIPYSEVYLRVALPRSCGDVARRDPDAEPGAYLLDPDGLGDQAPREEICELAPR